MKRPLLLLAIVACVSFVSCSDTLNVNDPDYPNKVPSMLEELQKRFDFSEVNTEGLEIKNVYEAINDNDSESNPYDIYYRSVVFEYTHPDLAVAVGEINDCLWFGLFDRESGKLKYQYTDVEHPTSYSYSAYGIKYEYEYNGVGEIFGIFFDSDDIVLAIQYFIKEKNTARLDLISFDGNGKVYRSTVFENEDCLINCYGFALEDNLGFSIRKWSKNTIYLYSDKDRLYLVYYVVYDFQKKELLCNIYDKSRALRSRDFISLSNPLHFWRISYSEKISITEIQCTYDTFTSTEEYVELFEPYAGDDSKAPRYSYEYETRTENYALVVVTQTQYDGSKRSKTVEIRLVDDVLKVEVQ